MKILLIEDNKILGESLKEYLQQEKFDVDWLFDDREFEDYFYFRDYDVVLLDLMLKFGKGENLLKKIKSKKDIPVIIITAKSMLSDKEVCFQYGADDYIVKPFNPKELIMRINAIIKRYIFDDLTINLDNDITIDLKNGIVEKNKEIVPLTKKEWDLLYILIKNKGRIVNNESILNYVWQDNPVGTESIRTYIKKLREIFGKDTIETFKGRGYRLK